MTYLLPRLSLFFEFIASGTAFDGRTTTLNDGNNLAITFGSSGEDFLGGGGEITRGGDW